ncbi:MAG: aspartate kinase [Clostridiales bacterium]|nr:aspartate kinase [Clostridiales bacterium]MCD8367343.1 aspartate kinase [Clostridiales bacterium]
MALIVQKFGGSSVANLERVQHVAKIITDTYRAGNDVVVVLSAQGKTTDHLIAMAKEYNPRASKRELDQLLTIGEQQSVALCAMVIEGMGYPVISLNAWQVGFRTNRVYGDARIKRIDTERLQAELDSHKIVIFTGFQGVNRYDDVTTLGRGGSDTSAVALAAVLQADKCQIFTDVDGVYTADPNKVEGARKIDEITYDEMLEMATLGAKVLHNRSVEMAKRYNVNLEVLSSFTGNPGTIVKEVVKQMENSHVSGVAKDKNIARLALVGLKNEPGVAFKVFSLLARNNVNVDVILQSIGRGDEKDISFTVARSDTELCKQLLDERKESLGFEDISINDHIAKVSIVGAGMIGNPGVAAAMFEALYAAGININMISTSEIKVSVLVDEADADRAVQVVHDKFFRGFGRS